MQVVVAAIDTGLFSTNEVIEVGGLLVVDNRESCLHQGSRLCWAAFRVHPMPQGSPMFLC